MKGKASRWCPQRKSCKGGLCCIQNHKDRTGDECGSGLEAPLEQEEENSVDPRTTQRAVWAAAECVKVRAGGTVCWLWVPWVTFQQGTAQSSLIPGCHCFSNILSSYHCLGTRIYPCGLEQDICFSFVTIMWPSWILAWASRFCVISNFRF